MITHSVRSMYVVCSVHAKAIWWAIGPVPSQFGPKVFQKI